MAAWKSTGVLSLAALLFSAAALAQAPEPLPPQNRSLAPTVTAAGSAEVSADPDRAVVRLGVTAQAPEASAAQSQVNEVMQAVLDAVTALGLPERAVRTEQLSLFPVYGNTRPIPNQQQPEEPRIVGYRASNVVSVETDDLENIGDVIDAGIEAGANELQGISFMVRDDARARSEALQLAVEDARAQADAMAAALGMRVAGLREIVSGDANVPPPQPYATARFALDAATPIQPGQVEVMATVTATFVLEEGPGGGAGQGGR